MADLPILFSAPMVRALLERRKTQTRRVIKGAPTEPGWLLYIAEGKRSWMGPNGYPSMPFIERFAKGDRLWVKETWRTHRSHDLIKPSALLDGARGVIVDYSADGDKRDWLGRNRVSIHMPRWASRLTLTVTDVRVQRLQAINAEDARDEGVDRRSRSVRQMWLFGASAEEREAIYLRACVWEYEQLWNEINGDGSWDANPWIVALTFTVEKRNIDA